MKPNLKDKLVTFAESLDRIQTQREAELQKLMSDPQMFDVAQQLTDSLILELNYLCNFQYAQSMGGRTDIIEVIQRLEVGIRETFKELTGKEYVSPILRYRRPKS